MRTVVETPTYLKAASALFSDADWADIVSAFLLMLWPCRKSRNTVVSQLRYEAFVRGRDRGLFAALLNSGLPLR